MPHIAVTSSKSENWQMSQETRWTDSWITFITQIRPIESSVKMKQTLIKATVELQVAESVQKVQERSPFNAWK